ncbi:MAG: bL17 family ribosomal protein [Patescibacteria group bacterium]|jgi:large subunit ribosomal protein L17
MRHRVSGKKLNRDTKHRAALIKNQVKQLIDVGYLVTTEAKSKVLVRAAEKVLNKAKNQTVDTARQISATLRSRKAATKATETVRRLDRPSGYIKVIRQGRRLGDNTMMVRLELLLTKESEKTEKSVKISKKEKSPKTK